MVVDGWRGRVVDGGSEMGWWGHTKSTYEGIRGGVTTLGSSVGVANKLQVGETGMRMINVLFLGYYF